MQFMLLLFCEKHRNQTNWITAYTKSLNTEKKSRDHSHWHMHTERRCWLQISHLIFMMCITSLNYTTWWNRKQTQKTHDRKCLSLLAAFSQLGAWFFFFCCVYYRFYGIIKIYLFYFYLSLLPIDDIILHFNRFFENIVY